MKLSDFATTLEEARGVIDRQEAFIAELRRDKARLDWLEVHLSDRHNNLSQPTPGDPTWQFGGNAGPYYRIDVTDSTLRGAIDAAMEASK